MLKEFPSHDQRVTDASSNLLAFNLSAVTTITSSRLSLQSTATSTNLWAIDCGLLERLRPVSQEILLTFTSSDFNNGGSVACALLPGSDLQDNFLTAAGNNLGLFENWENLAKVNSRVYDGRLEHGACVRWLPDNQQNDLQLRQMGS